MEPFEGDAAKTESPRLDNFMSFRSALLCWMVYAVVLPRLCRGGAAETVAVWMTDHLELSKRGAVDFVERGERI